MQSQLVTKLIMVAIVTGAVLGLYKLVKPDEPKFKVGDCAIYEKSEKESWEKQDLPIKILQVGKEKYLYGLLYQSSYDGSYRMANSDFQIYTIDRVYKKIECPMEFMGLGK